MAEVETNRQARKVEKRAAAHRKVESVAAGKAWAVADLGSWVVTVELRALAAIAKKMVGATGAGMERVAMSVNVAKGVVATEVEDMKAKVVLAMVEARAAEAVVMAMVTVVTEAEGTEQAREAEG